MQLLLQPVNWTALTLQSTVTDKARESWQQQLDLEAANLLSDICSEANGMNAIVIHLQNYYRIHASRLQELISERGRKK